MFNNHTYIFKCEFIIAFGIHEQITKWKSYLSSWIYNVLNNDGADCDTSLATI